MGRTTLIVLILSCFFYIMIAMEHEFLKEKYGLHKSSEVEKAAERTKQRTGEKVPQNPDARIQNYLDRLPA